MAYFSHLSNRMKIKASTLWSIYSMLKSSLKSKNDINIENYSKLTVFLKNQSKGYRLKKSKILSNDEIEKFINEAPDQEYLAKKAALIMGICGACRRKELYNLKIDDIKDTVSFFKSIFQKQKMALNGLLMSWEIFIKLLKDILLYV
ncbi:uncharacterized protein LOC127279911 [Leptopilina boulardi]|uniref:uncharacterized protein LOC127279911 n=1 Tax=Leptopilina boulardi TaxID=63433 RepID=UPI0021F518E1|nr:uncharacterized protein LOC127279911 [Leptopilina boulardi]